MARGSIFKRNSSYGYIVDLGPDPATGKRRQTKKQGFRTKREVEAALEKALAAIRDGTVVSKDSVTVATYLSQWLEQQQNQLEETTWSTYKTAVERITRFIGKRKLQALTVADVEKLYADLTATGAKNGGPLAAKTVRNSHIVLRKSLADGVRLGVVTRNVAASAKPPKSKPSDRKTWNSHQLAEFFQSIREDRLYAAFVLAATTGMRRAELMGLRWGDIDFDASMLSVAQTITTVGYRPVIKSTKTSGSRRVVYLDEQTNNLLQQHLIGQQKEKRTAGDDWNNDNDLVFRDELGNLVNPDWFSTDFARKVRQSGLPKIRLHDMRHSYATLALKAGMHPKVVSERLGHASVGITLDLYSHVTPAIAKEAADVVASKIFDS